MDVANELLDAIEIIVDKKIRENTAQIYPGICKSVSGSSCVMSINGKDNTIQFYGSIPTVGAIYRVFVPDGNMSMAFAITGNDDRKGLHYSNPNLLDNGYFGNPVNQRGQTEYTGGNVYTIDRWITLGANSLFSVLDKGVRIARKTDGDNGRITQRLSPELCTALAGKTCTLSALVNSFPKSGYAGLLILWDNVTLSEVQINPDSASKLISTTFTIPDSMVSAHNADYRVQISTNATGGDGAELAAVKLELGSTQTLAHQDGDGNWVLNEIPDYGEQLARCQRYFVNFNPNKVNWFAMPPAVASNTTEAYSSVTLPVAMRAQPTVSYGGKIALSQTDDVQVTGIQVSGSTFAGNYLQLKYSVADGLTANSTYRVQGYNDSTSYIWLSADL